MFGTCSAHTRAFPSVHRAGAALAWVLLVVGAGALSAGPIRSHATPPPTIPAAPLPAGAVARLGSTIFRHGGDIEALCYSPDGKRIVSVGDAVLRAWDAETGRLVFELVRPDGMFLTATFSPNDRSLIVVGQDMEERRLDIWRLNSSGVCVDQKALKQSANRGANLRLSADGSQLAVQDHANRLYVYNTNTGQIVWSEKAPQAVRGGGCAVAFSPDGKALAVAVGKSVTLYDAKGKQIGVLDAEKAAGMWGAVAFSPDGTKLVAGSPQHVGLLAWDIATKKILWRKGSGGTFDVAFCPDGKALVRVGSSFIVTQDAATGVERATLPNAPSARGVALTADGSRAAIATGGGTIVLYDPKSGQIVQPSADLTDEVERLRFSPDGKTVFGCAGNWLGWDARTGRRCWMAPPGSGSGFCFSPDGRLSAKVEGRGKATQLVIRELATNKALQSYPTEPLGEAEFVFTPNAQRVVGLCADQTIQIWPVEPGQAVIKMKTQGIDRSTYAISADGQAIATVTEATPTDTQLKAQVWALSTGKPLASFSIEPLVQSVSLSLSSDARRLAIATDSPRNADAPAAVTVWDTATGKSVVRISLEDDPRQVALSPDGRVVAIGLGNELRVCEVASGGIRFAYQHSAPITSLAFAPDGRTVAASSMDAPVFLWDVTGDLSGPAQAWGPEAANEVWAALAADGARGPETVRRLRAHPALAVPLLRARLSRARPDGLVVRKMLGDLGADDFRRRERATLTLAGFGDLIGAELATAYHQATSPEAQNRLNSLLSRLDGMTPDRVRMVRVVEAVEGIETPEAAALLKEWTDGPEGSLLADEARAALDRRAKDGLPKRNLEPRTTRP